jgi:hypothetical protein
VPAPIRLPSFNFFAFQDRVMADPISWPWVVEEMKYLRPGQYLGNHSIDFYLLQHWVKVKDTSPVLYLWIDAVNVCARREVPSAEECSAIRRRLLLPVDGPIPMRPVACVIHEYERRHYFVVVFNYRRLHVAEYGRHIRAARCHTDRHPAAWGGPEIWRNICTLFGWDVPVEHPMWWAVDWIQVIPLIL